MDRPKATEDEDALVCPYCGHGSDMRSWPDSEYPPVSWCEACKRRFRSRIEVTRVFIGEPF